MYSWYDAASEIVLNWTMATLFTFAIIGFIGFIIDKLRERKELRKVLSEKYIKYRIDRYIHRGY